MTDDEIRDFILETGEEIQQITEQIRQHTIDRLKERGFGEVVLGTNAFYSVWDLEMTNGQNPPFVDAEAVARILCDVVGRLGWNVKNDLLVTVVLDGRIKSRFFLSPAGEAGAPAGQS